MVIRIESACYRTARLAHEGGTLVAPCADGLAHEFTSTGVVRGVAAGLAPAVMAGKRSAFCTTISELLSSQVIAPFLCFLTISPLVAADDLVSPVLTMIFKPRRPLH